MKNAPRPTQEMIAAAQLLIDCRVAVEVVRPIIYDIKVNLLKKLGVTDTDGEPITDPNRSWLMDEKFVDLYYPALTPEYNAAGFDLPQDFCPLLVAENNEREAITALITIALPLIPASVRPDLSKIYDPETFRKMADLNVRYIMQFVKN